MHLSTHPTSYPTRYQEIAAKLEQELRQHYRCGDYLPAEQQLAARFEVNRHTLRRAIDQLVEKGWVQRRQGVGVLVLMRPFDYPLNAQARFSQNLLDQGSHPTSEKLLSVLRPASGHVADAYFLERRERPYPHRYRISPIQKNPSDAHRESQWPDPDWGGFLCKR